MSFHNISKLFVVNEFDINSLFLIQCYIAGVECLAVRISYTGELGWEIYSPINEMKQVYDSLCNEGIKICISNPIDDIVL